MNKAEVYIAKLQGLMNRFIELGKEYKGKPDSKKRQATIRLMKSQINDYREKLEGLGMGTITKTLFQVTYYEPPKEDGSKVVKEEKVFHVDQKNDFSLDQKLDDKIDTILGENWKPQSDAPEKILNVKKFVKLIVVKKDALSRDLDEVSHGVVS